MSDKKAKKVIKRLSPNFEVLDVYRIADMELAKKEVREKAVNYDAFLVSGGDGTLHHIVSAIADLESLPLIGYIPSGTLCDGGRAFRIKGGGRALKIIENGYVEEFDILKVNDTYALYAIAVGAYSDISYATSRTAIRIFGRLAYYFRAVFEALVPKKYKATISIEDKEETVLSPFFMLLNGPYIGGFKVNGKSKQNDGVAEAYHCRKGIFNGLLHYAFRLKVSRAPFSSLILELEKDLPWCLDGENVALGRRISVEVLPKKLRIFTQKPCKN